MDIQVLKKHIEDLKWQVNYHTKQLKDNQALLDLYTEELNKLEEKKEIKIQ